jgi:hypothetical protein
MKRLAHDSWVRQVSATAVATGGTSRDGGNPSTILVQGDIGRISKNSHVGRIRLPVGEHVTEDLREQIRLANSTWDQRWRWTVKQKESWMWTSRTQTGYTRATYTSRGDDPWLIPWRFRSLLSGGVIKGFLIKELPTRSRARR